MEVNCEGCAGCCIDWRAISPIPLDHERRDSRRPLDDVYNLVPLTRDDAEALLEAGLGDAMVPRLWRLDEAVSAVTIDGVPLAAIDGKPVFFLGLRKPVKPVAPFDLSPIWLPTCVFLDPRTLQCRIHDEPFYPQECSEYPGHNLALGMETECERVESAYGTDRLLDASIPDELSGLLLGPQAIGQKLFLHPFPDALDGVVDRLLDGDLADADRAKFVAAAVSSSPGSTEHDESRYRRTVERVLQTDSWAGRAIDEWSRQAGPVGSPASDPADSNSNSNSIEEARGAPGTPGWPIE